MREIDEKLTQLLTNLQLENYLGTECANCRCGFEDVKEMSGVVFWGSEQYPLCCSRKCFIEICPKHLLTLL